MTEENLSTPLGRRNSDVLQPITKEGYLVKEGSNFKTWRKRWFVVRGSTLLYYKTQVAANQTPLGEMKVTGGRVRPTRERDKPFCFVVENDSRRLFLCAQDAEEMGVWIDHIHNTIFQYKDNFTDSIPDYNPNDATQQGSGGALISTTKASGGTSGGVTTLPPVRDQEQLAKKLQETLDQGVKLFRECQFNSSIRFFQMAANSGMLSTNLFTYMGDAMQYAGRFEEALNSYDVALKQSKTRKSSVISAAICPQIVNQGSLIHSPSSQDQTTTHNPMYILFLRAISAAFRRANELVNLSREKDSIAFYQKCLDMFDNLAVFQPETGSSSSQPQVQVQVQVSTLKQPQQPVNFFDDSDEENSCEEKRESGDPPKSKLLLASLLSATAEEEVSSVSPTPTDGGDQVTTTTTISSSTLSSTLNGDDVTPTTTQNENENEIPENASHVKQVEGMQIYIEGETSKIPSTFQQADPVTPPPPSSNSLAQLRPSNIYFNMGLAYQHIHQHSQALKCFEKCVGLASAFVHSGIIYRRMNRDNEAIGSFVGALKLDVKSKTAWNNLGYTFHHPTAQDFLSALSSQSIEFIKTALGIDCATEEKGARGPKNFSVAEACYRKSLQTDEKYEPALFNLGCVLCEMGDLEIGISYLRECDKLSPNDKLTLCFLGKFLIKNRKPKEGVKLLLKCIELDSTWARPWFYLASYGLSTDEIIEGLTFEMSPMECLKSAVRVDPSLSFLPSAEADSWIKRANGLV